MVIAAVAHLVVGLLIVAGLCVFLLGLLAWSEWVGVGKSQRDLNERQLRRVERRRKP